MHTSGTNFLLKSVLGLALVVVCDCWLPPISDTFDISQGLLLRIAQAMDELARRILHLVNQSNSIGLDSGSLDIAPPWTGQKLSFQAIMDSSLLCNSRRLLLMEAKTWTAGWNFMS